MTDDISFNVFILGIKLVGILFIAASIVYTVEIALSGFDSDGESPIKYWHDAFYFAIVTLSTVGYGDISPQTPVARIIVMAVIAVSFIIIPLEVAKLAETYASIPKYRIGYHMTGRALHVIIATASKGESSEVGFEINSLKRMLKDIMHGDHGPKGNNLYIIVMCPAPPSEGIKNILNQPQYKRRVMYYKGSVQNPQDLASVKAEFADGIILMLNDDYLSISGRSREEQIMLSTMALVRYMGRAPRMPESVLINVQKLQRESGRREGTQIIVVAQDSKDKKVLQECGVDVVLCREELKLSLMAQSTISPAFLSFTLNSMRTSENKFNSHKAVRNFLVSGSTLQADINENLCKSDWLNEYLEGAGHEVYSAKIPVVYGGILDGKMFCEAAKMLYSFSVGEIILLGAVCGSQDCGIDLENIQFFRQDANDKYLKQKELNKKLGKRTLIMPKNMQFQGMEGMTIYSIVFVLGKSWRVVQEWIQKFVENEAEDLDNIDYNEEKVVVHEVDRPGLIVQRIERQNSSFFETRAKEDLDFEVQTSINDSRIYVEKSAMNIDELINLINGPCDNIKKDADIEEKYFRTLDQSLEFLNSALKAHIPKIPNFIKDHVVLIVNNEKDLEQYIIPLRKLKPEIPVIVITKFENIYMTLLAKLDEMKFSENPSFTSYVNTDKVYLVKGSARDPKVFDLAYISRAKAIVILSTMKQQSDSETLLVSFALEQYLNKRPSKPRIIVDLKHERSIYFLAQKLDSNGNTSTYDTHNFSEVLTSSNDTSVHGTKSNVDITKFDKSVASTALFRNVDYWPASAAGNVWLDGIMDSLCVQLYFNDGMLSFWEELGGIQQHSLDIDYLKSEFCGGCVHQMKLAELNFRGESYGELVHYMLNQYCMPIGLFRNQGYKHAPLPYTYINPLPSDLLDFGLQVNDKNDMYDAAGTSYLSRDGDIVLFFGSAKAF